MEKEIKKINCPECNSEKIIEEGTVKNNGQLNSDDYFSWVEDPYYKCRECRTKFDIVL
ncbi:MAG: hypothetical protein PHF86_01925 [Candidatus Nanoarchaeia archaeon]|nr:hypothetical protein [Candidatus Nanoarchaeia archaeon]